MRRGIITIWLILSIAGYGIVLAADLHGELTPAFPGADVLTLSDADPAPAPDQDHKADCGHCSHGASHLTGLSTHFSIHLASGDGDILRHQRAGLISRPLQTPFRPPILG